MIKYIIKCVKRVAFDHFEVSMIVLTFELVWNELEQWTRGSFINYDNKWLVARKLKDWP